MAEAAPALPRVVVVGSTGNVGKATVQTLSASGAADIVAVARNPDSDGAAPLKDLANVTIAAGSMGDPASLAPSLEGAAVAFIVTPGHIDRAKLTIDAANAAVAAGVPHLVVVSVSTAGRDTIFGRQFKEIEAAVTALDVKYTFLRLPMFFENNWGAVASIKGEGKIYNPIRSDIEYASVAVSDIADVATAVLLDPSKYENKAYEITTSITNAALAAAFTAELGKPVEHVQAPNEAAKAAFMGAGYPEWQVDGVLELFDDANAGNLTFPSDIESILGRPPTTIEQWVASVKGGFSD